MATTTLEKVRPVSEATTVPVVQKHHKLVRVTHWLNIPILLGLGMSGLSVYWASPVFKHAPHQATGGSEDYFADLGRWIVIHILRQTPTDASNGWIYDHLGLGTGQLSVALNLHWLFAYLFMLNGLLYLIGLGLGGGYKALLPRRTDLKDALRMQIYYVGLPFAKVLRRSWPHPRVTSKYNALQRGAYFAMPIMGTLSVLTGWAIHKPQQLGWLQWCFGGYDWARVWHFWLMWVFAAFVIPHVILVLADGWDTLRSMIVGWSDRTEGQSHGK